jgi:uncharacterized membrane protein SpoIIM required for sporulation/ABC-type transport system involved in multi-copper enzyme maturation permease subunit
MSSLADRIEQPTRTQALTRPARATVARTLRNALIVTRREVRDSLRDWRIMVPIFILTLIFPLLANTLTRIFTGFFEDNGAEDLLPALLPLMPMVVGFFPVSISLVIALETFVGEKERRSLEPLLSTPLTNTELYLGKTFAAMLPPLLASYTGMAIYMGGLILGEQQWRPAPMLVVQIILLTTVQALVMVTGAVVVSSQTTSTRAANLLASFIIIPMSMLVMLEATIMVQPHRRYLLWFIMIGVLVTVILLVRMGVRIFNREELLGRTLDQLNLRWVGRTLWQGIRGPAEGGFSLWRWYRIGVFPAVRAQRGSLTVVLICLAAAFAGGWLAAYHWPIPLSQFDSNDQTLLDNLRTWFDLGQDNPRLVMMALGQNIRVLLAATLLGIFTFGVLALVLVAVPFGILGFVLGQVILAGLSPLPFILAVIPHGVLEVPAIVLAGAAALRLGSIVTRPPADMTASEAWLLAAADVVKIGVGLVLPLLVLAAILEVSLTPRMVEFVLSL